MSRTPLAYRPNPDGWIDTSSTAKSRPSTQRPLTALRHNLGIATPPSSTFRHPRGKPKDETPLARQSNLVAYMTPPTTGSGKFAARPRGMQKVMNDVERELVTPSATATGRAAIKEKKMKDFWMLDAEPGPSQPRSTPSAKRPLRQRDENAQVDDGTSDGIISPRGKRIRKMDHIASQPIRSSRLSALRLRSPDGVSDGDEVEEDHRDGAQRHPPLDGTPERISQLGSDLPERTPVPSSVLAMHKRLCHQNSSGTRRIRSPWRPHGDSSPIQPKRERVKTGPEKREEVDARAKAIRNKENRKRELAVLSDEEETLDQRSANASEVRRGGAWETLQPNMDRKRPLQTQKRFVTGFASPRNRLRPASSTSDVPSDDARLDRSRHSRARSVQHEPHRHLRSVPGKARSPNLEGPNDRSSGSSSENALSSPLHRRARQRSSSLRLVSPIQEFARAQTPRASEVEQPPTTSPTRVITPDDRFDQTTPRKHRAPTSRHHITPKKSLSPKIMQTMNETLFAFSPPPQPRFSPPVQKVQKAWQPVSMDAETLITWAPAGWAETMEQMEQGRAHAEDADEALVDPGRREAMDAVEQLGKNGSAEVVRPHPTPLQERAYTRSGSSSSETESLAPSEMSQSFPHFVHSSPSKRSRSNRSVRMLQAADEGSEAAPETAGENEEVRQEPPKPQSTSTTPRPLRATPHAKGAAERWGKLHEGILSVPVDHTPTRLDPPSSSTRAKKRKSGGADESQLKLAAFGYFPSGRSSRSTTEPSRNFDKAWSDEEDLKLEPEEADDDAPDRHPSPDGSGSSKRLRRVPDAPYHPGLRPAGVAELERRRRESQPRSTSRSSAPMHEPLIADDGGNTANKNGPDAAAPSSSSMGLSSSSQSEELFPGFSGRDDDPREWLDQIGQRRSSEFRSFKSEDEFDFER